MIVFFRVGCMMFCCCLNWEVYVLSTVPELYRIVSRLIDELLSRTFCKHISTRHYCLNTWANICLKSVIDYCSRTATCPLVFWHSRRRDYALQHCLWPTLPQEPTPDQQLNKHSVCWFFFFSPRLHRPFIIKEALRRKGEKATSLASAIALRGNVTLGGTVV